LRPIFYDGQILNASDLGNSVGYGRDQVARHERYLHSWGIADGFDLSTASVPGASYVNVTVAAGVAFDGRGRELVLTSPQIINPLDFIAAHVYDPTSLDPWYPVYVQGTTVAQPAAAALGACAGTNPTTQGEGVLFNFGPPSPPNNSTSPYNVIGPADPTDPPNSAPPWNILIGFVKWDPVASQFTDAQAVNGSGVSPRRAGVQAARVEAQGGALTLQTSDVPASRLMLVLEETVGNTLGAMTFGPDNGKGGVKPLLQINTNGDLTVFGKIGSATPLAPGSISVQSGIATDGITLPLPAGVADADVTAGKVVLHIQVTPIVPEPPLPPSTDPLFVVPLACYVDGSRRVRCRLRCFFTAALTSADVAGTCHYTIVATAAAGGTSS
jgi:hypothetical protein